MGVPAGLTAEFRAVTYVKAREVVDEQIEIDIYSAVTKVGCQSMHAEKMNQ